MGNLNGKRLLILSGGLWKDAIKAFADSNGITIIAAGNDPHAAYWSIADEAYCVDSIDAQAILQLIKDKHIDGVYMGSSEPVIGAASKYLNDAGLPCYCTKAQWDTIQNKVQLKACLNRFGLPTAKKYEILPDLSNLSETNIRYPVITKPVDGCGSSGFSVCIDEASLRCGFQKAADASSSGKVIVEEFLKNRGVVVFYSFSNGEARFVGIEDKYPVRYERQGSYVAGFHSFESAYKEEFRQLYDAKLTAMFKSLGLKEGTLWIEVFRDNGRCYFNEAGYRYSGSLSVYPVDYLTGINQVAADIYYALTGESRLEGFPALLPAETPTKRKYGMYNLHTLPGVIDRITGKPALEARSNIVLVSMFKQPGAAIEDCGNFSQVAGCVHFVYDDAAELAETVQFIHDTIKIADKDGRNLINKMLVFDPKVPCGVAL